MIETDHDIQPLSSFQSNSEELLLQLKTTLRPITLTVNGEPQAVLQDPASYQRLLDLAAQADAYEGIRQGLEQMRQGKGRPAREVFDEMRARYAIPR